MYARDAEVQYRNRTRQEIIYLSHGSPFHVKKPRYA
jgi:hypothetical protein